MGVFLVFYLNKFVKKTKNVKHRHRNSAQIIVEANNLAIKTKIEKFESADEETCRNLSPCSIVVTEAEDEKSVDDKNANRLSIASTSSIESSRSDNIDEEAVNGGQGSSVFYVVWD